MCLLFCKCSFGKGSALFISQQFKKLNQKSHKITIEGYFFSQYVYNVKNKSTKKLQKNTKDGYVFITYLLQIKKNELQ